MVYSKFFAIITVNVIEFEVLYKGLIASNSVNTLNFANNLLDDNTGRMIGKLISAHSEKRDQYRWVYSIRGEQPEEDIELKGNLDYRIRTHKA